MVRSCGAYGNAVLPSTGRAPEVTWRHKKTGRKVTLPRHTGDMSEGTLRAVLREAGIGVDDFLKA